MSKPLVSILDLTVKCHACGDAVPLRYFKAHLDAHDAEHLSAKPSQATRRTEAS